MLKIARILTLTCFICCWLMLAPMVAQDRDSSSLLEWRLAAVEQMVTQHDRILREIRDDITWVRGGIAMMFGLLGIIGAFNIKVIAGKAAK